MKEIKFENILKVDGEIKEKVRQWRNKDEIRKYMINQHIITKEEHLNWLDSLKDRNDWKFFVVFIDEIPIGLVCLQCIDYKKLTSEGGVYIGEDDFRGIGIGAIIEFILLEYFFNILKFRTLIGIVLETNIKVLKMHRKFGFRKGKNTFGKNKHKGIFLEINKTEWNSLRKNILIKLNIKENITVNIDGIKSHIFL